MQFINTVLFAATALATMASAENFIQFINQANVAKNIVFTQNAGLESIEPLELGPLETANQTFPQGWIGNFYSYNKDATNVPGMLGEVRFNGFADATYFDVSSIVNPSDVEGVKILYPFGQSIKNKETVVSGCQISEGCTNQYNAPNDIATQSTPGTALICLVGKLAPVQRRRTGELFSRDFVTS